MLSLQTHERSWSSFTGGLPNSTVDNSYDEHLLSRSHAFIQLTGTESIFSSGKFPISTPSLSLQQRVTLMTRMLQNGPRIFKQHSVIMLKKLKSDVTHSNLFCNQITPVLRS
jgi:hypothetical protein